GWPPRSSGSSSRAGSRRWSASSGRSCSATDFHLLHAEETMIEYFHAGGVAMWPLLLMLLAVLFLAGHAAVLQARDAESGDVESRLLGVLFWGGMSLLMGVLGTMVGLVQMADAISRFGPVRSSTLAGGVGVALITSIFGLLIFLLAAVLWFSLRQRHL